MRCSEQAVDDSQASSEGRECLSHHPSHTAKHAVARILTVAAPREVWPWPCGSQLCCAGHFHTLIVEGQDAQFLVGRSTKHWTEQGYAARVQGPGRSCPAKLPMLLGILAQRIRSSHLIRAVSALSFKGGWPCVPT